MNINDQQNKLERITEINDLGVIIDKDLQFDKYSEQDQQSQLIVGIIRRTFINLDEEIFVNLSKALVRPHQ